MARLTHGSKGGRERYRIFFLGQLSRSTQFRRRVDWVVGGFATATNDVALRGGQQVVVEVHDAQASSSREREAAEEDVQMGDRF